MSRDNMSVLLVLAELNQSRNNTRQTIDGNNTREPYDNLLELRRNPSTHIVGQDNQGLAISDAGPGIGESTHVEQ
jgi:hypothetical protein